MCRNLPFGRMAVEKCFRLATGVVAPLQLFEVHLSLKMFYIVGEWNNFVFATVRVCLFFSCYQQFIKTLMVIDYLRNSISTSGVHKLKLSDNYFLSSWSHWAVDYRRHGDSILTQPLSLHCSRSNLLGSFALKPLCGVGSSRGVVLAYKLSLWIWVVVVFAM